MQVRIKEQSYAYEPDFDPVNIHANVINGWKVSAGDYFKFPIRIGPADCFVKRFSKKKEEVSGWEFIAKIKGKVLAGLPVVYDLVTREESGREVHYLFLELLAGDTLENLQREGFSFLPVKLGGDLYLALRSIHESGFWFPDFDPKNLFRTGKGDFYIIDLDSVYPMSILPVPAVFGSKDYWAPVYDYYRLKMGFSSTEIKTIRGDVLNMLHLLYFLSLYSFYLLGGGEDLTGVSLAKLNEQLSKKHQLFHSILVYCFHKNDQKKVLQQTAMPLEVFMSFINICLFPDLQEKYISTSAGDKAAVKPKVLFTLKGNKRILVKGDPYELIWQTANASSVYLDGTPAVEKGSRMFTAQSNITHTLKAIHSKKGDTESSIVILVEEPPSLVLRIFPLETRSGQFVTLDWEVKNGARVKIFQDGVPILPDCAASGLKKVPLTIFEKETKRKTIAFNIQAEGSAGGRHMLPSPVNVVVVKKDNTYIFVILIAVAILILVLIVRRAAGS